MLNNNPFPSIYEEFIHKSRYARWQPELGRRENWDETVSRLVQYYFDQVAKLAPSVTAVGVEATDMRGSPTGELYDAIYNREVMPSMRAMMTAGPVLDRCHVPAYNCAYAPVDSLRTFDEAMYILMCGTGLGYSVETKYIDKLPIIPAEFTELEDTIVVADSKEGWAKAFKTLLEYLSEGGIPQWDVSKLRPAGARLKTFGGRSSGPEPLVSLFNFSVKTFVEAAGRRLTSLECHDLMCKVGDVVVSGGVRRSALISLFDCTDERMATAKSGAWWEQNGQRALANNSAVYENRRPDTGFFMKKWKELYDSKSGEPGFFSRYACERIAKGSGRRVLGQEWGTNPCSEIILRPFQFCNLSEVVVRPGDTPQTLAKKVELATILGTIQSSFTDFKYLRKVWRDTCEEERLLGVSLTGVCDNLNLIKKPGLLASLKQVAIDTNKKWAELLGIKQSAAITCVKPSGTVSQLVNSASGLHARHSPHYLRTVRASNNDPMTLFLKDEGVYWEPSAAKPDLETVFYFPQEAPKGVLFRDDLTSQQSLELWKLLQDEWCEHKPSITVYVKEDEWLSTGSWVFDNFDTLSGVAFLPYDGGTYKQAPYQEVTKQEYKDWIKEYPSPDIDWELLRRYEAEDNTTGSQELACSGGICEVVDITRSEPDG